LQYFVKKIFIFFLLYHCLLVIQEIERKKSRTFAALLFALCQDRLTFIMVTYLEEGMATLAKVAIPVFSLVGDANNNDSFRQ